LEAHKNPKKGPLATVLIKTGTLKVGQDVLVGNVQGRIRKIEDYSGKSLAQALPSTPVTIIGLSEVPQSNDVFQVKKEKIDKKRKRLLEEASSRRRTAKNITSSKEMIQNIDRYLGKKFSIILKSDAQGTLEAIKQILNTIKSPEVSLNIINEGVGPITETNVHAAQTNNATVYGFNVFPTSGASRLADTLGINTKTYSVIYELIEDIKNEMSEMLEPEIKRTDLGRLKVLAIFKNMKKGMVFGGKVMNGKMVKGEHIEILRDKVPVGTGIMTQLQHNKQDVGEVKEGLECGIAYEGKDKVEIGDTIISFKNEEIKRKI
jgi:translation initiation factor IF-2